jgi:hypothetical protein
MLAVRYVEVKGTTYEDSSGLPSLVELGVFLVGPRRLFAVHETGRLVLDDDRCLVVHHDRRLVLDDGTRLFGDDGDPGKWFTRGSEGSRTSSVRFFVRFTGARLTHSQVWGCAVVEENGWRGSEGAY